MMVEEAVLQRRRSQRIPASLNVMLEPLSGGRRLTGTIVDLADAGARIRILDNIFGQLTMSSRYVLTSNGFTNRLSIEGRPIWIKEVDQSTVELGIKFEPNMPQWRSRLQELVYLKSGYVKSLGEGVAREIEQGSDDSTRVVKELKRLFGTAIPQFIKLLIKQEQAVLNSSSYSSKRERQLVSRSEALLKRLEASEKMLTSKIGRKQIRKAFRASVANWAYKSVLVRRGYEKPRGYPGDYEMLEKIYDNEPVSREFGLYWDQYFLKDAYAEAVRNRKDAIKLLLEEYVARSDVREPRILNLACGSCKEIRDLFAEKKDSVRGVRFTCVDQDEEALAYAQTQLKSITNGGSIEFVMENILNYARYPERYLKALSGQDMIYSIGLADYLPDRMLQGLIQFAYQALKKGGELVLAHKDCDSHEPLAPKWYCDWQFIPRNEQSFVELIQSAGTGKPVKVIREPSGHVFITVSKKTG